MVYAYIVQGCIQDSGLGGLGQIELPKILGGGGDTIWECIGVQRLGGGGGGGGGGIMVLYSR